MRKASASCSHGKSIGILPRRTLSLVPNFTRRFDQTPAIPTSFHLWRLICFCFVVDAEHISVRFVQTMRDDVSPPTTCWMWQQLGLTWALLQLASTVRGTTRLTLFFWLAGTRPVILSFFLSSFPLPMLGWEKQEHSERNGILALWQCHDDRENESLFWCIISVFLLASN